MSEPVKRTLRVLEFFSTHDQHPVSLAEVAKHCDIAMATLFRIINTLEDAGYIQRQSRTTYSTNFEFRKSLPISRDALKRLEEVLKEIADSTQQTAEAILIDSDHLLWHSKHEYKDLAIRLRAQPGFRRGMYELDSLSRLYLKTLGWDKVSESFDKTAFFRTGIEREFITVADAEKIIESTDANDVAYDIEGNVRGIRRFAKVIFDTRGNPLFLICIAEAALRVPDMDKHISRYKKILHDAADSLKNP
jgi:DNA-binding IclR family transcriptional regulator